ncbi:MAG: glycoside hydrolase family 28 protein [Tannerella forsythia]|uniref:glycoside hydrolase family 28 protein n=1 Tax=Tannerella forsythia TaxID=28112 RepID=UPI0028ED98E8|nr:glycosyl hydrolase family 28 protein [Tannerella forsythia]
MKILKSIIFCFSAVLCNQLVAKDYNASLFGIRSDGATLNTRSIQKAIDHIHDKGGGRLVFSVGRYLTGTIYLKSNVTLHLKEGAVLLGSTNPLDYDIGENWNWTALVVAHEQHHIGITGQGVIDGRGYEVANNLISLINNGIFEDALLLDRPREFRRPQNIYFKRCRDIHIQGILLKDPASWNQQYEQCRNMLVEEITTDSKAYWNNDGIDIVDCDSVIIRNSYFDAADDGICLKSHSADHECSNIYIYNNTVRTSASGIKFGTVSAGGFRNIRIVKNTVFNTYRSAITFASVDGAVIDNVTVDSLVSINTGNVIFLRTGTRTVRNRPCLRNIRISNVYAEVPATKPDAGYRYEGPIEDLPRNVSPCIIAGIPSIPIENVTLENIEIRYPGGGNALYAKVGLDELDSVPEMENKYPEFSMFKELPAWGFYIRHAKDIRFNNVTFVAQKADYRPAVVLDDVHNAVFKNMKISIPESAHKDEIVRHCSSGIHVEP